MANPNSPISVSQQQRNLRLVFKKALENLFIDRMDQNKKIAAKFLNEKEFKEIVSQNLLEHIYE